MKQKRLDKVQITRIRLIPVKFFLNCEEAIFNMVEGVIFIVEGIEVTGCFISRGGSKARRQMRMLKWYAPLLDKFEPLGGGVQAGRLI